MEEKISTQQNQGYFAPTPQNSENSAVSVDSNPQPDWIWVSPSGRSIQLDTDIKDDFDRYPWYESKEGKIFTKVKMHHNRVAFGDDGDWVKISLKRFILGLTNLPTTSSSDLLQKNWDIDDYRAENLTLYPIPDMNKRQTLFPGIEALWKPPYGILITFPDGGDDFLPVTGYERRLTAQDRSDLQTEMEMATREAANVYDKYIIDNDLDNPVNYLKSLGIRTW